MRKIKLMLYFLIGSQLYVDSFARNRKDRERNKDNVKILDTNLCTMEGNSAELHCVCVGGVLPFNASSVECWVFTGVTKNHGIWSLFATQPYLRELKICVRPHGLFNFVPTTALRHLKQLRTVEITYASIHEIHPYAFANLTTLTHIKLTRNKIVTLHEYAFAHLTNLLELNLDENRISELRCDVFVDLPNLQKLFIVQNNVSVIQEGAFRHLAHLVELELDGNYINVLTRETFTGLSELKKLDLSNNEISMLGYLTFSELWILEELQLESNEIEFISNKAFAGLTHLKKLGLSNNRLKSLSDGLLGTVPAVNHLDLRDNDLETLTLDSIKPILNNFLNESSYLYLDGNKFTCDCRLAWMHRFKNDTKNEHLRYALEEMICFMGSPESVKEMTASPLATKHEIGSVHNNDVSKYNFGSSDDNIEDDALPQSEDPRVKHLFEIPLSELPCPQKEKKSEKSGHLFNKAGYEEMNTNSCAKLSTSVIIISIGMLTSLL